MLGRFFERKDKKNQIKCVQSNKNNNKIRNRFNYLDMDLQLAKVFGEKRIKFYNHKMQNRKFVFYEIYIPLIGLTDLINNDQKILDFIENIFISSINSEKVLLKEYFEENEIYKHLTNILFEDVENEELIYEKILNYLNRNTLGEITEDDIKQIRNDLVRDIFYYNHIRRCYMDIEIRKERNKDKVKYLMNLAIKTSFPVSDKKDFIKRINTNVNPVVKRYININNLNTISYRLYKYFKLLSSV